MPPQGSLTFATVLDDFWQEYNRKTETPKYSHEQIAAYLRYVWNQLEKAGVPKAGIGGAIATRFSIQSNGNILTPSGDPAPVLSYKTDGPGGGVGGGGNGGGGNGDGGPSQVITDAAGNTGYDRNGDGWVDEVVDSGTATDTYSVKDYLAQVVGQYGITSEIRDLAAQAAKNQWTMGEFTVALSKTQTYQNRQSLNYKAYLSDLGLSGGNLDGLVQQAVANGYTESEFLYFLRKTPEYRDRFKGIYQNGKMVMSEQEYITFERDLKALGKQYGYNVTGTDIGQAVRKGFDSQIYEERLQALQRIREYEPALRAFMQTARAMGMKVPANPTKRELYDFVTGKAEPAFYKLWEESAARTAAYDAGLNVIDKGEHGKAGGIHDRSQYTSISRGLLRQIIQTVPGQQTEGDLAQPLSETADSLLRDLPAAKIQSLGLSKQDIIRARFGGKGSAEARKKLEHVAEQWKATQENELAQQGSYVGQGGRLGVATGRGQGQATE